jgi:hypothetical protein
MAAITARVTGLSRWWRPGWGPQTFDPVRLGNEEADAWAAYYRREWLTFLRAAMGMVRTGCGTDPVRTVVGAYHVLRANQLWAPHPNNDPDGARSSMRRFYALVAKDGGFAIDPVRASELEVEWWRVHREHQHSQSDDAGDGPLVDALAALYAYVYGAPDADVRLAAEQRALAMRYSDQWVQEGRYLASPLIDEERAALVRSYAGLLAGVHRV